MKKIRITLAILSFLVAFCIIAATILQWRQMDCSFVSCLMAVVFYGGATFALWFAMDDAIKQYHH